MTMMIPRLRRSGATPVEDHDGVLYYDVNDPKTGGTCACSISVVVGAAPQRAAELPDLARWTEEQFGFSTTSGDLEAYGSKLLELGMARAVAAAASVPVAPAPVAVEPAKPAPVEHPRQLPSSHWPPAVSEPVRAKPERSDDGDDVMGRPVITLPATRPTSKPATQPEVKAVPAPTAKPGEPAALPEPPQPKPIEPVAAARWLPGRRRSQTRRGPVEKPAEPAKVRARQGQPAKVEPAALSGSPTVPIATVAAPSAKLRSPPTSLPRLRSNPARRSRLRTAPSASTPVGKTPAARARRRGRQVVVILLVLAAVVGAAYYFLVYLPKMNPPAVGVRMSEAKPETMPRKFAVPAQVKPAEPVNLKIDADGDVAEVVAEKARSDAGDGAADARHEGQAGKKLADARKLPPVCRRRPTRARARQGGRPGQTR